MNNGIPASLLPIIETWKAPQEGMSHVVRWLKYHNDEPGVRRQDSSQHTISIVVLAMIVVAVLRKYIPLDGWLLTDAFSLHDLGEGECKKDTHYIDKSVTGDLEEYLAFRQRYEFLGPVVFESLHPAFLLQFAAKNPSIFPKDAQRIMADLCRDYPMEILVFDAIERWDYVLYALEQYHERGNEKILTQVLRHQVPHLDVLAVELPGFGVEIWKSEISLWAHDFLKAHEGQWIEQKSAA